MKSYGEEIDLNLKLIVVFNKCFLTIGKKDHESIHDTNLTVPQFLVLEKLYHKGDLKVGEIIEKTLSSIGNINVVVNNLEKQNLVKKERCTLDRRVTYVKMTEQGKKLMDEVFPKHIENICELTNPLTKEEKETLIRLLKKWGKA